MKNSFFTRLAAAGALFCALATAAQAQTLHLITVGNPAGFPAEAAKHEIKKDVELVDEFFQANIPASRLHRLHLVDPSANALQNALDCLWFNSDDVVVFYFTGHGGNELDEGGQVFQFFQEDPRGKPTDETRLSRKVLRRSLAQNNPRLVVILTDCSNAYTSPLLGDVKDPATVTIVKNNALANDVKEPSPLAQKLFFEPTGRVDMTSTKFGEYAYIGNAGASLWTSALIDVLNEVGETLKKNPNATTDWGQVADQTIEKAQKIFQAKYPNGSPEGQTTQTPHVYELPGAPRLGARAQTRELSLTVTEVIPGSPAEKAGLQVGDQLVELRHCDSGEVKSLVDEADYSAAIDFAPRDIELTIQREVGNKPEKHTLTVELNGVPVPKAQAPSTR